MILECRADWFTEEFFRCTATLVGQVLVGESDLQNVVEQYAAVATIVPPQTRGRNKLDATVVRLHQVEQISRSATCCGGAFSTKGERQLHVRLHWCGGRGVGSEWEFLSITLVAKLILSWGSINLCGNHCGGGEIEPEGNATACAFAGSEWSVALVRGVYWHLWGTRGGVPQQIVGSRVFDAYICVRHFNLSSIGKSVSETKEGANKISNWEEVGCCALETQKTSEEGVILGGRFDGSALS